MNKNRLILNIIFILFLVTNFSNFCLGQTSLSTTLTPKIIWAMPTSVRIKWTTPVPGDSKVEYGLTPNLGNITTPEMADDYYYYSFPTTSPFFGKVTTHYVNIPNLLPETTYYFRVRTKPIDGGPDLVSEIQTFKTFKPFGRLFKTIRYSSYILGGYWTESPVKDKNAPYWDFNGQSYDLNIAYSANALISFINQRPEFAGMQPLTATKLVNPNAQFTVYDNINHNPSFSGVKLHGKYAHWLDWAEKEGISYEEAMMHHGHNVDVQIHSYPDYELKDNFLLWGLVYNKPDYRDLSIYERGYTLGGRQTPGKLFNNINSCWFIGNDMRFDVIEIKIATPAGDGYDGVWEYVSAVDDEGWPSQWSPLTIVEDTTKVNNQKFAKDGRIRFVPPKERIEWKRARIWEGTSLGLQYKNKGFLIRFRTTATGTPPNIALATNEDWAPVRGLTTSIPGWDISWESNPNNNGDPEYNPNPPANKRARFKWWSRAWYYNPNLRAWFANLENRNWIRFHLDYWLEFTVKSIPILAGNNIEFDGYYVDNYIRQIPGYNPFPGFSFIEYNGGGLDAERQTIALGNFMEEISHKLYTMGKYSMANNFIGVTDNNNPNRNPMKIEYLPAAMAPAFSNREMYTRFNMSAPGKDITGEIGEIAFVDFWYHVKRGHYQVQMHEYRGQTFNEYEGGNTESSWKREKIFALAWNLLIKDTTNEYVWFNAWDRKAFYGEFLTQQDIGGNGYWQAGIPKQKAYYVELARMDFGVPDTSGEPPLPGFKPMKDWIGPFFYKDITISSLGTSIRYYARRYSKALILMRPRKDSSLIKYDNSSLYPETEIELDRDYYLVDADGNISFNPINRINLRNSEAAILIPAEIISSSCNWEP